MFYLAKESTIIFWHTVSVILTRIIFTRIGLFKLFTIVTRIVFGTLSLKSPNFQAIILFLPCKYSYNYTEYTSGRSTDFSFEIPMLPCYSMDRSNRSHCHTFSRRITPRTKMSVRTVSCKLVLRPHKRNLRETNIFHRSDRVHRGMDREELHKLIPRSYQYTEKGFNS